MIKWFIELLREDTKFVASRKWGGMQDVVDEYAKHPFALLLLLLPFVGSFLFDEIGVRFMARNGHMARIEWMKKRKTRAKAWSKLPKKDEPGSRRKNS